MSVVSKSTAYMDFQGKIVECTKLSYEDGAFTMRIPDVAVMDGDYAFQFWGMTSAYTYNIHATLGDKTQDVSITNDWEHKVMYFHDTDVSETNGALEIEFTSAQVGGTSIIYLYHLQLEKGTVYTDWAPNPDDIEETMEEAASQALDFITQEALFNKLTNNGQLQGLFMQGGELYMNATYIQSGTLSGAQINIGNGAFTVAQNGAANASSLSISGGSIDLGNGAFHVSNDGSASASNLSIAGGKIDLTATYSGDTATKGYINIESTTNRSYISDRILQIGNALSGSTMGLQYQASTGEMQMWNPSDRTDYIRLDSTTALQYMVKDGKATTLSPDGLYLGMNSSDKPTGVLQAGDTDIYGRFYQYDTYSRLRMFCNPTTTDTQIVLRDASGNNRCIITLTGINFYDASGTWVKGL